MVRFSRLDTFPAHWRRLEADPLNGNWWAVMQHADVSSIGAILELAALPALEEAARIEPDERAREWMNEVLSHG